MSGKRWSPSITGPMSGLRKRKLMWSSMSMRSPARNVRFAPPAALVTSSTSAPNASMTRAGNATVAAACPSYRW